MQHKRLAIGDEKNLLAVLDVQTPFLYMAQDRPADALLLESGEEPYQPFGSLLDLLNCFPLRHGGLFRLSELLKLQISIAGEAKQSSAMLSKATESKAKQAPWRWPTWLYGMWTRS